MVMTIIFGWRQGLVDVGVISESGDLKCILNSPLVITHYVTSVDVFKSEHLCRRLFYILWEF
jgi:hypothetical protein